MQKSTTMNMTEGRPLVLLSVFALPLLIGNIFQQVYNLADSMIVGQMLGANALAAVGTTGSITFLFFSVFNGIGSGCGIVTSQYFGAGKEDQVRLSISNSAYITLGFSVVTGLLAFVLTPAILSLMRTPPEILPDAVTYMRVMAASAPLVALYNYIASMRPGPPDHQPVLFFPGRHLRYQRRSERCRRRLLFVYQRHRGDHRPDQFSAPAPVSFSYRRVDHLGIRRPHLVPVIRVLRAPLHPVVEKSLVGTLLWRRLQRTQTFPGDMCARRKVCVLYTEGLCFGPPAAYSSQIRTSSSRPFRIASTRAE